MISAEQSILSSFLSARSVGSLKASELRELSASSAAETFRSITEWGRTAWQTVDKLSALQDLVRKASKVNDTLLDLGGGWGYVEYAKKYGFSKYACVDRYRDEVSSYDQLLGNYPIRTLNSDGMRACFIKADMLEFLDKVRPGSCSVFIGGIDLCIISSSCYHRALVREILRVTAPGAVVFGALSESLEILKGPEFNESVDFIQEIWGGGFFRRK